MRKGLIKYWFVLFLAPVTLFSQSGINHEKYWIYRERLNNYLINGTAAGCVIPAGSRQPVNTESPESINWSDSPWELGYWIGNLAMEYDLLIKSGFSSSSPEVMRTKQDLFNAIEAVNRLDFVAEGPLAWNCGSSLNGFSIVDDVPVDFHERFYNGKTGADLLNESAVPPPDGFRAKCMNSGFAKYVVVREVSKDHLVGIYIGLALVKKFIPENENYNNQAFMDNSIGFVDEIRNISNRYISWMVSNEWTLFNTCANRCVHGVCNPISDGFCGSPDLCLNSDPCSEEFSQLFNDCVPTILPDRCNTGGAQAKSSAIGFAATNLFIQRGSIHELPALALYNNLIGDFDFRFRWNGAILVVNERLDVTLAAIGNVWNFAESPPPVSVVFGSSTKRVAKELFERAWNDYWEHLLLIHRLLYGTQYDIHNDPITMPDAYYECLLNSAPCRGYDGFMTAPNAEWGEVDRLAGNRKVPPIPQYNVAFSRVDFLFYFNLYCETNPNYLGTSYTPIPLHQLALRDIDKFNYTEFDKKNFIASNSITARDGYIIDTDLNGDKGRVTFKSGKFIDLLPGFEIRQGSFFDASIDPTISSMTCTEPSNTNCTANERIYPFDTTGLEEFFVLIPDSSEIIPNERFADEGSLNNTKSDYQISIEPNPNPGSFNLRIGNGINPKHSFNIELMESTGNVVYITQSIAMPNTELNFGFLQNGVYLLNVIFEDGTRLSERIVIIK